MKTEKDVRPREPKQRELLTGPLHSESTGGHEGALVWWRKATGTRLPLGWGELGVGRVLGWGECWGCPLWGPAGLLRCHLHTLWQTPLVWLFTPPPISFLPPSWTVEWRPQPGRDHRQGRRLRVRQSRLLAPSLHTYVASFCLLPLFLFFSGSRVPLLILCLQDFYQGLTQTYATCQPTSHGHAAWSQTQSRLNLKKDCSHEQQPTIFAHTKCKSTVSL